MIFFSVKNMEPEKKQDMRTVNIYYNAILRNKGLLKSVKCTCHLAKFVKQDVRQISVNFPRQKLGYKR